MPKANKWSRGLCSCWVLCIASAGISTGCTQGIGSNIAENPSEPFDVRVRLALLNKKHELALSVGKEALTAPVEKFHVSKFATGPRDAERAVANSKRDIAEALATMSNDHGQFHSALEFVTTARIWRNQVVASGTSGEQACTYPANDSTLLFEEYRALAGLGRTDESLASLKEAVSLAAGYDGLRDVNARSAYQWSKFGEQWDQNEKPRLQFTAALVTELNRIDQKRLGAAATIFLNEYQKPLFHSRRDAATQELADYLATSIEEKCQHAGIRLRRIQAEVLVTESAIQAVDKRGLSAFAGAIVTSRKCLLDLESYAATEVKQICR